VARLAAIAAIRTFLNYFLERDIDAVQERRAGPVAETQTVPPSAISGDRSQR
jgi:hypothetical protein